MWKVIPGCALALCLAASASAQDDAKIKTETKVTSDNGKVVTMTGCLMGGGTGFILSDFDDHGKSGKQKSKETVGTSGVSPYALTPREGLDLGPHVGQRVEVTGVIVPAANRHDHDDKIQITEKTKVEVEDGPDKHDEQKAEVKVERGATDQFLVASVKDLKTLCVR
jgi:hypothetical protein